MVSVLLFIFAKRERVTYYMQYIIFHYLLVGTLKEIYHTPRPYYVDTNIEVLNCAGGYGLPSGHTSGMTIISFTFFFLDYQYYSTLN